MGYLINSRRLWSQQDRGCFTLRWQTQRYSVRRIEVKKCPSKSIRYGTLLGRSLAPVVADGLETLDEIAEHIFIRGLATRS
jgi:hypothetical protein